MSRFTEEGVDPAALTIGDVAARTGLTVADLRNWEVRYGVPAPTRSGGGQRRYRESDCRLVADIARRRANGVALSVAVRQAQAATSTTGEDSIYRAVRRQRPDLAVHRMDKGMLLALTWAIEDQCCHETEQQILIGAFQRTRYYEAARLRWESMSSTSDRTIVFADFDHSGPDTDRVVRVPLEEISPLRREWALISDSVDLPACLLAWEPPGQEQLPERRRQFEMVWSVSPDVVRQAARVGVGIAARSHPALIPDLSAHLAEGAPPASADLVRASGVFERTLDYLVRSRRP